MVATFLTCLHSYCTLNGGNISSLCPGFDYIDPIQRQEGCQLNFSTEQDCLEKGGNKKRVIYALTNTYWERKEYDILTFATEETCQEACLEDCDCVVAQFRDQLYFKQKLSLRYGRKNSIHPTKAIWSYKIVSGQACSPSDVIGEISLRSFSSNHLVVGTDDFKKAIGREGSGRVYKGCLGANNSGKEIAVKSLEKLVKMEKLMTK
ncbi:hypothetical protein ACOSP7_022247 [Xanthoceras sorbifolium]